MRNLINSSLYGLGLSTAIAYSPNGDGGGGGSAAAADGGDPAAVAAAAAPAAGAVTPPAGGEGANPQPGQQPAKSEGPYKPEGIGENLLGKDDRETIDKLLLAQKGYRDRDAARQVPDAPEGYRDFAGTDIPETLKPHIDGLSKDPLFDAAAKVAKEEGIGKSAMQKMTVALYSAAAEAGILEPPVDTVAERAALLPENYANQPKAEQDKAINARLQANEDFINLQVTNKKISREVADHALGMLMDTAKGNQFLEFFRTVATGGNNPQPGMGGGNGGADQAAALKAELAALETEKGKPEYKAKHAALMQKYQSLHGE